MKHFKKVDYYDTFDKLTYKSLYHYHRNYLKNICVNYFKWEGLPTGLNENLLENWVVSHGYICCFVDDEFGIVFQRCSFNGRLNLYDQQTEVVVISEASNFAGRHLKIAYSLDDVDFFEENNQPYCFIISNNYAHKSYNLILHYYATKLAKNEMTALQNLNALKSPYIALADDNDILSVKQFFNKIDSFDPVVFVNRGKDKSADVDYKQLSDYLNILPLNSPYLLDKLELNKQNILNDFLSRIGLNNVKSDKRERLLVDEVNANNELVDTNIEVGLSTRKTAVELINEAWGLDLKVYPRVKKPNFKLNVDEGCVDRKVDDE